MGIDAELPNTEIIKPAEQSIVKRKTSPAFPSTPLEDSAVQEVERKLIPDGNVAIVGGMSRSEPSGIPTDGKGPRFWAYIGTVARYEGDAKTEEDEKLRELRRSGASVPDDFETDDRSELIELTHLEDGVVIAAYPVGEQVRLDLLRESFDLQTPERTTNVPAAFFREHGFDLDTSNRGNIGKELDPEISQRLYDLQVGQGEFTVPTPKPPTPGINFK
jgi:hypothetical protein